MVRNPFKGKKDEKAKEFQETVALTEQGRQGMPMTEDYVNALGRSVYSIIDPELLRILEENDLEYMIPWLSHLNRMTQYGKDDVELAKLDLEYFFLRIKCTMDEADYDTKLAHLMEALQFFARNIITDSFEGFKAKLLAYTMKIIRTELEEKKTKGWFG